MEQTGGPDPMKGDRQDGEARRELAAILFSDIVGYTAIMGRDEQKGLDAIRRHREQLRQVLPRYRGRLVGEIGDGSLSSFPSVVDAVACARELQSELAADDELKLRIGIHLGDVVYSGNTLLGDGVNIASRIHGLAEPGGICISSTVYDEIRNKPGIVAVDLGEKTLKNVSRPIHVYALSARSSKTAVSRPAVRPRTLVVGGLVVLGVMATFGTLWWKQLVDSSRPAELAQLPPIRSIAVLPLDNYSGDPGQDYFADGMTDELTTDLATVSQLRVISRGSAMHFKGASRPSTPEIARTLGVDAIIEGSVVRVGDRVRITAQLVDARADRHLWARSFERDMHDVLALQGEIASAIAGEVSATLTPAEHSRLTTAKTVTPEAYDAYLKARQLINSPSDANVATVIAHLEETVRLDPDFAPAYAGLSDAWAWAAFNETSVSPADGMVKAKQAAEKALALDDHLADAHNALAGILWLFEYNFPAAENEFRRAIELNPSYGFAHDQFGISLAYFGRLDEAREHGERAVALDPLAPGYRTDLALTLAWQGNVDAAVAQVQRARELDPTLYLAEWSLASIYIEAGRLREAIGPGEKAVAMNAPVWVEAWLGYLYGATGQTDRAHAILDRWNDKYPAGTLDPFNLAVVDIGLGERERALDELERAYAAHSGFMALLGKSRAFDPLRAEPRFAALVRKIGFAG
ncbi:MAG TPA: adenylate/guanylate cyclase domain-containing protein [Candidatus Binatia bacterium]